MRRVLVALFGHNGDKQAMAAGLDLAKRHGGHVAATHVAADPYETIPIAGEGMSAHFVQTAIDAAKEQAAKRSAEAKETFDAAMAKEGGNASELASWSLAEGRPQQVLPRLARVSDVTVIGGLNPNSEPTRHITFEALLFASGRPILLVPEDHDGPVGTKVVVGWNDTPEATHAVGTSMDLLRKATAVDIVTAARDGDDESDADHLKAYLQAHEVSATATELAIERRHVADILLDRCKDQGANLLMIGGYGHSRIGEIIFGGVTHDLMQRYDVPVLIAH